MPNTEQYTKTVWENEVTPLNAENLNKIEDNISALMELAADQSESLVTVDLRLTSLEQNKANLDGEVVFTSNISAKTLTVSDIISNTIQNSNNINTFDLSVARNLAVDGQFTVGPLNGKLVVVNNGDISADGDLSVYGQLVVTNPATFLDYVGVDGSIYSGDNIEAAHTISANDALLTDTLEIGRHKNIVLSTIGTASSISNLAELQDDSYAWVSNIKSKNIYTGSKILVGNKTDRPVVVVDANSNGRLTADFTKAGYVGARTGNFDILDNNKAYIKNYLVIGDSTSNLTLCGANIVDSSDIVAGAFAGTSTLGVNTLKAAEAIVPHITATTIDAISDLSITGLQVTITGLSEINIYSGEVSIGSTDSIEIYADSAIINRANQETITVQLFTLAASDTVSISADTLYESFSTKNITGSNLTTTVSDYTLTSTDINLDVINITATVTDTVDILATTIQATASIMHFEASTDLIVSAQDLHITGNIGITKGNITAQTTEILLAALGSGLRLAHTGVSVTAENNIQFNTTSLFGISASDAILTAYGNITATGANLTLTITNNANITAKSITLSANTESVTASDLNINANRAVVGITNIGLTAACFNLNLESIDLDANNSISISGDTVNIQGQAILKLQGDTLTKILSPTKVLITSSNSLNLDGKHIAIEANSDLLIIGTERINQSATEINITGNSIVTVSSKDINITATTDIIAEGKNINIIANTGIISLQAPASGANLLSSLISILNNLIDILATTIIIGDTSDSAVIFNGNISRVLAVDTVGSPDLITNKAYVDTCITAATSELLDNISTMGGSITATCTDLNSDIESELTARIAADNALATDIKNLNKVWYVNYTEPNNSIDGTKTKLEILATASKLPNQNNPLWTYTDEDHIDDVLYLSYHYYTGAYENTVYIYKKIVINNSTTYYWDEFKLSDFGLPLDIIDTVETDLEVYDIDYYYNTPSTIPVEVSATLKSGIDSSTLLRSINKAGASDITSTASTIKFSLTEDALTILPGLKDYTVTVTYGSRTLAAHCTALFGRRVYWAARAAAYEGEQLEELVAHATSLLPLVSEQHIELGEDTQLNSVNNYFVKISNMLNTYLRIDSNEPEYVYYITPIQLTDAALESNSIIINSLQTGGFMALNNNEPINNKYYVYRSIAKWVSRKAVNIKIL